MTVLLNPYRFATSGGGGGGAAEVVGSSQDSGVNNTQMSVAKPAGTTAGDLLLLFVLTRNSLPSASGPDGGGWTSELKIGVLANSIDDPFSSGNEVAQLWSKVAGGAEPGSYTLDISDDGTDGCVVHLAVLRGVTTVDGYTASDTQTAPSIDGTAGGVLLGVFGSAFDTGSYTGPPSGMTEQQSTNPGAGTNDVGLYTATEILAASGATGTRTPTTTVSGYDIACLVATS